jgi:TPR repeat protein
MTTVPGTYFTKEQLEAAVRGNTNLCFLYSHSKHANEFTYTVDRVWDPGFSGSGRMNALGYAYRVEKKQYEKALAWYILSVRENNGYAPVRIGILYFHGYSLPRNYLCALRWFLKGAKLNNLPTYFNEIGELFEYGFGVSLDKNMALDWYIHVGDKEHVDRLKSQGYRQSAAYKSKFEYTIDSLY